MTKKDGDKLRKMHNDCIIIGEQYEPGSETEEGMRKVGQAILLALAGRKFRIVVETTRVR